MLLRCSSRPAKITDMGIPHPEKVGSHTTNPDIHICGRAVPSICPLCQLSILCAFFMDEPYVEGKVVLMIMWWAFLLLFCVHWILMYYWCTSIIVRVTSISHLCLLAALIYKLIYNLHHEPFLLPNHQHQSTESDVSGKITCEKLHNGNKHIICFINLFCECNEIHVITNQFVSKESKSHIGIN